MIPQCFKVISAGLIDRTVINYFLVPDQVDDIKGALSQFQVEFCNRYGLGPNFVADTLQNAIQKAFGTEARKRKLLGKKAVEMY